MFGVNILHCCCVFLFVCLESGAAVRFWFVLVVLPCVPRGLVTGYFVFRVSDVTIRSFYRTRIFRHFRISTNIWKRSQKQLRRVLRMFFHFHGAEAVSNYPLETPINNLLES